MILTGSVTFGLGFDTNPKDLCCVAEYKLDRSDFIEFSDSWLALNFIFVLLRALITADGLATEFNRFLDSTVSSNFSTFCIGANTPYSGSHRKYLKTISHVISMSSR